MDSSDLTIRLLRVLSSPRPVRVIARRPDLNGIGRWKMTSFYVLVDAFESG